MLGLYLARWLERSGHALFLKCQRAAEWFGHGVVLILTLFANGISGNLPPSLANSHQHITLALEKRCRLATSLAMQWLVSGYFVVMMSQCFLHPSQDDGMFQVFMLVTIFLEFAVLFIATQAAHLSTCSNFEQQILWLAPQLVSRLSGICLSPDTPPPRQYSFVQN